MDGLHDVRPFRLGLAVRRHVLLIVTVTVGVAVVVGAFTLRQSHGYTATSRVVLKPLVGAGLGPGDVASSTQINVAMQTEAGIVSSPGVVSRVSDKLNRPVRPAAVTATVPPNTKIVQIQCSAATAKAAQVCAQEFAVEFLAYRSTQAKQFQQMKLDATQGQVAEAEERLREATAEANSKNPAPDAAVQVQLATSLLTTLQTDAATLAGMDTDPGRVVKEAVLPSKPTGLSPFLMVAAALILGLGVGVGLAVWRERSDDRFRATSESNVLGIPLLSSLPPVGRAMPRLLTDQADGDSVHNAYRRARTALVAATNTPATLVVSAVPGDGHRADVAANLALTLSNAGYNVTLVDAGIDDDGVASLLDISDEPGLSESLSAQTEALPRTVETAGIRVLPAGSDRQAARDQYAGTRLPSVLRRLRSRTDFVIVAGPTAGTPEGNAVALAGDGLILVFPDRSTTHHELAEIIDDAERLGITLVGAISTPRQQGRAGRLFPTPRDARVRDRLRVPRGSAVSSEGAASPPAGLGPAAEASA